MTTKEVAKYLNVAESTVSKYAENGKLKYKTEKRYKIYDLKDVIKLQQKIEEETDRPIFNEKSKEKSKIVYKEQSAVMPNETKIESKF